MGWGRGAVSDAQGSEGSRRGSGVAPCRCTRVGSRSSRARSKRALRALLEGQHRRARGREQGGWAQRGAAEHVLIETQASNAGQEAGRGHSRVAWVHHLQLGPHLVHPQHVVVGHPQHTVNVHLRGGSERSWWVHAQGHAARVPRQPAACQATHRRGPARRCQQETRCAGSACWRRQAGRCLVAAQRSMPVHGWAWNTRLVWLPPRQPCSIQQCGSLPTQQRSE